MKKRLSIVVSIVVAFLLFSQVLPVAATSSTDLPEPLLRVENQSLTNGYDVSDKVDQLKQLDEGTIIVRFRHTGSSVMSLFSLSNNRVRDGHFNLYITPSVVGSENRLENPGEPKTNIHINTQVNMKEKEDHTLAMVMDKEVGY
ncbi:hypothetical protein NXY55_24135, partial [Aeromonas veronii]|nr:hypothetical protein [Aeromonas veronii]